LQHFIFKLILLFSAILSVNSALAVPLSSVINSDIQHVEYRQIPAYKSLDKPLTAKNNFQLTKNETYKSKLNLSPYPFESCLSKGKLIKLTATCVKRHYQQQAVTILDFSRPSKNLYVQQVSHQTENLPSSISL